jgi:hypothetical protein
MVQAASSPFIPGVFAPALLWELLPPPVVEAISTELRLSPLVCSPHRA